MKKADGLLAAWLALVVFVLHVLSPNVTQGDSRWTVFTAWSLLHEGNADLNEFVPQLERVQFYGIECVESGKPPKTFLQSVPECPTGRLYNYYPLGVPLMIAPGVAAMEAVVGHDRPFFASLAKRASSEPQRLFLRGEFLECTPLVELLLASAVIAIATLFLFLYLRATQGPWTALLLALLFAFATPAWSTGSRALWMHGFSMMLIAAAFWTLRGLPDRPWTAALAGGTLALAFFVRPTNVGALACLGLWVLMERRSRMLWFVMGVVPIALVFSGIHAQIYGSWLPTYSKVSRPGLPGLSLGPHVPRAIMGNLFSPARGLLVFSPFVLFSMAGLWRAIRDKKDGLWPWALGGIIAIQFVLICLYEDWSGGDSYGPRYFSDVAPVFVATLPWILPSVKSAAWRSVFAASVVVSLFMHYQGATCWPCVEWSARSRAERGNSASLWDWNHPPFLANFQQQPSPAPKAAPR